MYVCVCACVERALCGVAGGFGDLNVVRSIVTNDRERSERGKRIPRPHDRWREGKKMKDGT